MSIARWLAAGLALCLPLAGTALAQDVDTVEPARLRLTSSPAPWPRHWPFVAVVRCGDDVFVASERVYVSRDGRRWRHARGGLPRRYFATNLACIDGIAFVVGYPGLIARWQSRSRRWETEHVAANVRDFGPFTAFPVMPYLYSVERGGPTDPRLRSRGLENVGVGLQLIRRSDGTWERSESEPDVPAVPRRCGPHSWIGIEAGGGALELCANPPRLLIWRSPLPPAGPGPPPDEVLLPHEAPDSYYERAWFSPSAILVSGPWAPPRPWIEEDRPHSHQVVTLYHHGEWRRATVRGYAVSDPVEIGGSVFFFTTHGIHRVVRPARPQL